MLQKLHLLTINKLSAEAFAQRIMTHASVEDFNRMMASKKRRCRLQFSLLQGLFQSCLQLFMRITSLPNRATFPMSCENLLSQIFDIDLKRNLSYWTQMLLVGTFISRFNSPSQQCLAWHIRSMFLIPLSKTLSPFSRQNQNRRLLSFVNSKRRPFKSSTATGV